MAATVRDLTKILEEYFPLRLAAEWDNCGLQIGSLNQPLTRALIVLDLDQEIIDHARKIGADLIITHHPLFFSSLKSINYDSFRGRIIRDIVKAGIAIYSVHTNLDAGERGLNQILAETLGLHHIEPLDEFYVEKLYKLVVYVPLSHTSKVRDSILNAGAGHIGRYQDCSFKVQGTGSFRPLEGSQPYIGEQDLFEEVEEDRLETIVPASLLEQTLKAMREAHPYEEVAFDVYPLQIKGQVHSFGRIGLLPESMVLDDLCIRIKEVLSLNHLTIAGDLTRKVRKIGVVSGAGASLINQARKKGCDVVLTGDVKYHEAKDAVESGMIIIDAGHQGTEKIMAPYLCSLLTGEVKKRELMIEILSIENQEVLKIR